MNIKYLIVHHTGGSDANPLSDSSNQTFEVVNAYHRDTRDKNGDYLYHYGRPSSLGYYLAYHYYIDKQGKVTTARIDSEKGYHTIGYNDVSLGICLAGNFDATFPTEAQIDSLKTLLKTLLKKHVLPKTAIVPHRTFAKKSCYGRHLPDTWAQNLIQDEVDTVQVCTSVPVGKVSQFKSIVENIKRWFLNS